jgi:hypothetical protein
MRTLSFLHHGVYIRHNGRIYRVDWKLHNDNNVVDFKTNKEEYIDEDTRVEWLRTFENFKIIK